jgi:hypothetical protein
MRCVQLSGQRQPYPRQRDHDVRRQSPNLSIYTLLLCDAMQCSTRSPRSLQAWQRTLRTTSSWQLLYQPELRIWSQVTGGFARVPSFQGVQFVSPAEFVAIQGDNPTPQPLP